MMRIFWATAVWTRKPWGTFTNYVDNFVAFFDHLKSSRNKKDLKDVTAAPFSVFFLLLAAEKKTPKTGQL